MRVAPTTVTGGVVKATVLQQHHYTDVKMLAANKVKRYRNEFESIFNFFLSFLLLFLT